MYGRRRLGGLNAWCTKSTGNERRRIAERDVDAAVGCWDQLLRGGVCSENRGITAVFFRP